MKKYLLLILGCIPLSLCAQRVVILPVDQLPALEFEASSGSRELTIITGNSVTLGSDLKIRGGSGIYSYKWSPGITLNDSMVMKPIAKPDKNATYILTVTDLNGCSFGIEYKVTVLPATPVNLIPEGDRKFNVFLYPNPASGSFKVHITGKPARVVDLMLTDNLGRVVAFCPVHEFDGDEVKTLQLRFPPGTYILVVKRDDDVVRRKLINR